VPQLFWFAPCRKSVAVLWIVALIVNVGMWLERYVIIVVSLHRDYLPSSWGLYSPTIWDWATFIGSMGLFATLLFLFVRLLPVIAMFEMREMVAEGTEVRGQGSGVGGQGNE
jgi:molybdopterin-containing oxidoreductase family membrane subunit